MSNVTTIHDALLSRIAAVLPVAKRLTNPHEYEENDNLILSNGYAVRMGPARNTKRNVLPKLSIERTFTVCLTRQIYALDSQSANRAATEKQLLEDQVALIKDIEKDPTIGAATMKAVYESDNGINFLASADEQFYVTETVYLIEYFEDLT